MVQFRVLSGNKAGSSWGARRFPVRIGRAADADLRLEEAGVWDQHLEVAFVPKEGFVLHVAPNALATLNAEPVRQAVLRNGDRIALGSLQLQFWLGDTRQAGLRWREALTWAALAAVSLSQIALVYWVLR